MKRQDGKAGQLRLFEPRANYAKTTRQFPIAEVFGFPYDNQSTEARRCRESYLCPFISARCVKGSHGAAIPLGTCTVHSRYGPIITCPLRFYVDDYRLIDHVTAYLMGHTTNVVRIPEVGPNQTYNLDWIVACYDENRQLSDYHGVEVQTIDITGSVRPYFEAYMSGERWEDIDHRYGINWANVFKRFLPQLLAKGAMLASYGKKLGVILQDQLVAYLNRTRRLVFEKENDAGSVNVAFFVYELRHSSQENVYRLELVNLIPTAASRLESAFIAGLVGAQMPSREEFDRVVASKMTARLAARQS